MAKWATAFTHKPRNLVGEMDATCFSKRTSFENSIFQDICSIKMIYRHLDPILGFSFFLGHGHWASSRHFHPTHGRFIRRARAWPGLCSPPTRCTGGSSPRARWNLPPRPRPLRCRCRCIADPQARKPMGLEIWKPEAFGKTWSWRLEVQFLETSWQTSADFGHLVFLREVLPVNFGSLAGEDYILRGYTMCSAQARNLEAWHSSPEFLASLGRKQWLPPGSCVFFLNVWGLTEKSKDSAFLNSLTSSSSTF